MENIHYYKLVVKEIDLKLEDESLSESEIESLLDKQEEALTKIHEIQNCFINSQ